MFSAVTCGPHRDHLHRGTRRREPRHHGTRLRRVPEQSYENLRPRALPERRHDSRRQILPRHGHNKPARAHRIPAVHKTRGRHKIHGTRDPRQ